MVVHSSVEYSVNAGLFRTVLQGAVRTIVLPLAALMAKFTRSIKSAVNHTKIINFRTRTQKASEYSEPI